MCGITGIVLRRSSIVSDSLIRPMTDSMHHRGPDEDGIYIHENTAIGMRRLSIMDVAGGTQPLFSKDGNIAMVGNGEIYNFRTIQDELKDFHQFTTRTDMEVVAPLYQKYGLDFPNRMEGMFGLAVLDKAESKLHLIRDRIGIKPLFIAQTDNAIVFSSDINSILASGHVVPELNEQAVSNYFNYRFGALGCDTFFKNIRSLWPGEIVTIDTENFSVSSTKYHNHVPFSNDELLMGTEQELTDELEKRLRASVTKRLMADVPLGTLLSSGIDSTLLTALANDINPSKVDAFTIGYAEKSYDESDDAKESADHLGIKWHRYAVSNEEYTDLIIPGIRKNEAPITHPNSLAVHLITKLARENGYKVLLSGEGADELFAGYGRTTDLHLLNGIKNKYPKTLLKLLTATRLKFNAREAGILNGLVDQKWDDLLAIYFSVGEQDFKKREGPPPFIKELGGKMESSKLFNHILQVEQRSYLQELLLRQDKMSMWSSMEVRVPFVGDPEVVKFANQLSIDMKLKDGINKYLLRKVAERYLPKHICYRKKRGFGSPVGDWLKQNDQLKDLAFSLKDSDYMDTRQKKYYTTMLEEHTSGKADNYEIIWKMMNYLLFRKEYNI
ncbi:MAG: asparagine synthase (glutamine-hydrolyzing) [Flavobacteriales bacterium]|nr:asparagine synthase (glutamine-hydrolyzing) [Flavobacteriales bacterium]